MSLKIKSTKEDIKSWVNDDEILERLIEKKVISPEYTNNKEKLK